VSRRCYRWSSRGWRSPSSRFIATQYFPETQLQPILTDWAPAGGGLYFVTPTARARPAKVSALADFLIAELTMRRGAQKW